jgi:alkylation response protein AidB-like acyl-CoA dehydrogenase
LIKENGFLRTFFPEEYGGIGTNMTSACIISEETAKVCVNTASILAAIALSGINILLAGNDRQKRWILSELASGACLCSTAMTEPNAGSDIGSLETRAVSDGDHYVLNGTKVFCTNADVADIILVFARTTPAKNPAERHKGISIDGRHFSSSNTEAEYASNPSHVRVFGHHATPPLGKFLLDTPR